MVDMCERLKVAYEAGKKEEFFGVLDEISNYSLWDWYDLINYASNMSEKWVNEWLDNDNI